MPHRLNRIPVGVALCLLSLVAGACGSSPTAPSSSTSLSVIGTNNLGLIGSHSFLTAVLNRDGAAPSNVLASWTSSNNNIVSVSGTGITTAVSVGTALVTATYGGATGSISMLVGAPLNCSNYDPAALVLLQNPDGSLTLASPLPGGIYELIAIFDTATDAANGLALYQRYRTNCYVGRNNARADRLAYISSYWINPSGQSTTIQPEDCTAYNPSSLQVVSQGSTGWALMAGGQQLLLLDTAADATTMASITGQYSNQCYIGRQNTRSNPIQFITTYWK